MGKVIVLVLVLFGISSAYAAGDGLEVDAGTTPDSTMYFMDRMVEDVQMFFTFGHEAKARLHAMHAEERIAEMEMMVEKGRMQHMRGLVENYEMHMESSMMEIAKAEFKGKNETAMMHNMAKRSSMHMQALQKMHGKAPEVRETLEVAMNKSMRGYMVSMAGGRMGEMMQKSRWELNRTMMERGMPMSGMMQKGMGELNRTMAGQKMPMTGNEMPMMDRTSEPKKQTPAKKEPATPTNGGMPMTKKPMH